MSPFNSPFLAKLFSVFLNICAPVKVNFAIPMNFAFALLTEIVVGDSDLYASILVIKSLERITFTYENWKEEKNYSQYITLDQIKENDYALNPKRSRCVFFKKKHVFF